MRNEEIIKELNNLHLQSLSLDDFDSQLQCIKEGFVNKNDQEQAKQIWIYQAIIKVHKLYRKVFYLLKNKSYYDGWCQLERIEMLFKSLKRHFRFDKNQYYLWHIEKSVKNLQVIFPYRLFASSEILKKEVKCSVCDKAVSIRNSCGHEVGEIYDGEICHRIVTKADVLGISVVQNPGNKYSVVFLKDEKTGQQIDHYNYDAIDYFVEHIKSPYDNWELEVSQREIRKEDYQNSGRNDLCPCNSGKKFKKCCIKRIGEKYPHFEFILTNPSKKTLLSNSLKMPAANNKKE